MIIIKTLSNLLKAEDLQKLTSKELAKELKKAIVNEFKAIGSDVKVSVTSPHSIYCEIKTDDNKIIEVAEEIARIYSIKAYSTIYVNSNYMYYSDCQEYKENQRKEYEAQQEEYNKQRAESDKLYNDNVKIDKIENVKIINVEDRDIFVLALEPSCNKNNWKITNDKEIEESSHLTKYKITDIVELNEDEYNYFSFNLLNDYEFLSGKGGSESDDTTEKFLYSYAVAVYCKGKEILIIDPQGYSYARYTSKFVKSFDKKLETEINNNIVIDDNNYNKEIEKISNINLYIYYRGIPSTRMNQNIIQDERLIFNKYNSITAITGLTYKEMLKVGNVGFKLEIVTIDIKSFAEGILKFENKTCFELFTQSTKAIDGIKFSERLMSEIKRASMGIVPEPPKTTKKEVKEAESIKDKSDIKNNIIDFSAVKNNQSINASANDNEFIQASKRQLYALYCATKVITTNLIISKDDATKLIKRSLAKENIINDVKKLIEMQNIKLAK